jgi:prolyl 4-hydroxylase
MKRLDDSWQGWLKENLERGCKREDLLGILLDNAFHIDDIARHMGAEFPAECERARRAQGRGPARVDHAAIAQTRITRLESGAERIESPLLQIYRLPAFLSSAECDELVSLIDRHLRKSTVTLAGTDDRYRTSRTADLSMFNYQTVARVDQRIAQTLGIHPSHSEGIQAQRYDVGEEFKQHTDYFEPGTDEYREHASSAGNRTWTFMIYLNDVERGGGTRFYALGRDFQPVKGSAVIWNSLNTDGTVNPHSMHAGLPVEAGHKIVITKWFRERGNGPLLLG